MAATEVTKRLVWVRAGGRCILCNENLISTAFGAGSAIRSIGEVAHIAGESATGPRGTSEVDVGDRNAVDNLLLLCPTEHTEADSGRLTDPHFTEEFLRERKRNKEAWIEFVTGLAGTETTTVLRVSGDVRGSTCLINQHDAASAIMRHSLRTPRYLPDPRGVGLTVDVTTVPDPGSSAYWESCLKQIDHAVDRLRRSAQEGETSHVSVFAFALVPLLVALGNALDDTLRIDVYDRHRATDSWNWDPDAQPVEFGYLMPSTQGAGEAVLIVNATGTIQTTEIPEQLADLPVVTIAPLGDHTPGPLTFASHETLISFRTAVRLLIAELEEHKSVRHVHLLLAAPVSACVDLGRVWPVDNAAPSATVYHRSNNSYEPAVELPRSGMDA